MYELKAVVTPRKRAYYDDEIVEVHLIIVGPNGKKEMNMNFEKNMFPDEPQILSSIISQTLTGRIQALIESHEKPQEKVASKLEENE